MTKEKQLHEVFKTVGLPPYTYVKPTHFGEIKNDILQNGRHLLIEGPSGVGKTCVVFKVFEELSWGMDVDFQYVSCRDDDADEVIADFLAAAAGGDAPDPSVIVVDDFHLLDKGRRGQIGSRLKRMSDRVFETGNVAKVILIGIPTAGDSLLANALDLGPRLGSYRFWKADDKDIDRLISEGEEALNVLFEDRDILLSESAGNFWLAQYICSKICATESVFETEPDVKVLKYDLLGIRKRLMAELTQRYQPIAKTFAKGKKWRPGGNKPYLEVLLALAKLPESVASFDKILTLVPERRRPGIKAIRTRIAEVIYDPSKPVDLRGQIAFDPDAGFSIEDPLFRYYLSNLEAQDLLADLGIEQAVMAVSQIYAYDIGFSFAGEVRRLVEAVNAELKAEDVITFYDFDQQAVLLALDLQDALAHVYAGSCRYFLVFMDKNYKEKLWTRFEQDIMTHSGRKEHIIPVVLDEEGSNGIVGIPSTLGRLDLREAWSALSAGDGASAVDVSTTIRNRCVLPLLAKIDGSS